MTFEKYKIYFFKPGFTILELLISLGIFAIIAVAAGGFLGYALKNQRLIWDQLEAQSEGRNAVQQMVNYLRKAQESSTGAYAIESAATSSLVFYTNVDSDSYIEKVHFFRFGSTLKQGITKPSGSPLTYNPANEIFSEIAHYLVNPSTSTIFSYYDENYAGTGSALAQPVEVTQVRLIRVQLQLDKNPQKSPIPFYAESVVSVRNLKSN